VRGGEFGTNVELAARQMSGIVDPIGGRDQGVELGQRIHFGDRDKMTPAEPANLAFHTALFVTARQTRPAEKRAEAKVTAQGNEPLGLRPATALQHPGHRRLQVVIPDPPRDTTQLGKRPNVSFEERFLTLAGKGDADGLP
jgi:hypothetical protein